MAEKEAQKIHAVHIPSLKAAFADAGLSLPESSPLQTLIDSGDDGNEADSNIDWPKEWNSKDALSCLAQDPKSAITILALDQKTHHFVFSWTSPDSFCLYSHDDESAHLTAPIAPGQIAAFLAEDFGPFRAPAASGFGFSFTMQGFQTFAAIVDFCRYVHAVGLMERTAVSAHMFTLDQLLEQVKLAKAKPDYRWLLACLPELFPTEKPATKKGLKTGCDWMIEQGLLQESVDGKANALSPDLLSLAVEFVDLGTVALITGSDGPKTAFLAAGGIWRINFYDEKIDIASIDGLELITQLNEASWGASGKSDNPNENRSAANRPVCTQCGTEFKRVQRFCSACGEPSNAG